MLANPSYLLFLAVQLVVAATVHFYFLGTGRFLQDKGVSGPNVSAAMGIAQATQAVATILLLMWLIQASATIGFLSSAPVLDRALPDLPGEQMDLAPGDRAGISRPGATCSFSSAAKNSSARWRRTPISGSAQSLIFAATTGVGFFLGRPACRPGDGAELGGRQVPLAADLGRPAGDYARRQRSFSPWRSRRPSPPTSSRGPPRNRRPPGDKSWPAVILSAAKNLPSVVIHASSSLRSEVTVVRLLQTAGKLTKGENDVNAVQSS